MQKPCLKITAFLFITTLFLLIFLILCTGCDLYTVNPQKKENSGEKSDDDSSNSQTPILYVTNSGSNTVTYFNAITGAYINGNLTNSSFTTGSSPTDVTVNPSANILYVINWNSNTVTYFNAATGKYINGTLANSSFSTGDSPYGVAVSP